MPTSEFSIFLEERMRTLFGSSFRVKKALPVGGGSINECFELQTSAGSFFLKRNIASAFPEMFQREKEGLELIRSTSTIHVPMVYLVDQFNDQAFLVMEFFQRGEPGLKEDYLLGRQLAMMHQCKSSSYGLATSNYIGSLKQENKQTEKWSSFFFSMRILPMAVKALNQGSIDRRLYERLLKLEPLIDQFSVSVSPSLLHGDLWSGNYMITNEGQPIVFDPAVYYGNREIDLAMTLLFGGFSSSFYKGYDDQYTLDPGWKERVDLWNLYPLLVHVNLFGGSYGRSIEQVLKRFSV